MLQAHLRVALLAIAVSLCAAGTARAAMVTFEDYAPRTALVAAPGQSFSAGGLSFTGKDYQYLTAPNIRRGTSNGTEVLVAASGTSITKSGGGPFVLHSIDLGQSYRGAAPAEVTLTRNFAGGGSVTEVVSLSDSFRTFTFDPVPLNSFEIGSNGAAAAIDNIVYTQGSGPTSLVVWATIIVVFAGIWMLRARPDPAAATT